MLQIVVLLILSSCSVIQNQAVNQASKLMLRSSENLTQENSWDFFRESSPGNLKLIETLYYTQPDSLELLTLLIKGHAGYAFGVFDTLYLKNRLADKKGSSFQRRAIEHYTRSMNFGFGYLKSKGVNFQDLKTNNVDQLLDRSFSDDDATALFYFAQSWGQIINYNRSNLNLIGELSYVQNILNWVCKKNPYFEEGICDIYKAVFEAQKPRLLGGDPKVATQLFKRAIKKYPKNLLIRVSFIEYSLIPSFNDTEYYIQKKNLRREFSRWKQTLDYSLQTKRNNIYEYKDLENLYNAIALKRFGYIQKLEKDLF